MLRKLNQAELGSLKIGSIVMRIMGPIIDEVMVSKITPELVTVVTTKPMEEVNRMAREGGRILGIKEEDIPYNILPSWEFDPKTGEEIDEDITEIQIRFWGDRRTISYLAKEVK